MVWGGKGVLVVGSALLFLLVLGGTFVVGGSEEFPTVPPPVRPTETPLPTVPATGPEEPMEDSSGFGPAVWAGAFCYVGEGVPLVPLTHNGDRPIVIHLDFETNGLQRYGVSERKMLLGGGDTLLGVIVEGPFYQLWRAGWYRVGPTPPQTIEDLHSLSGIVDRQFGGTEDGVVVVYDCTAPFFVLPVAGAGLP